MGFESCGSGFGVSLEVVGRDVVQWERGSIECSRITCSLLVFGLFSVP